MSLALNMTKSKGRVVDPGQTKGMALLSSLWKECRTPDTLASACKMHPGVLTYIIMCGFHLSFRVLMVPRRIPVRRLRHRHLLTQDQKLNEVSTS